MGCVFTIGHRGRIMGIEKNENSPLNRYNFLEEKAPGAAKAPADPTPVPDAETISWQKDLLVQFLKNQLRVAPAMPILALLLAVTVTQWVSLTVAIAWLLGAIACQGVQMYLCHAYFRKERSYDEQRDWIGMLSASELLTGVCWFLPLFLFWNEAGSMQQIYLIASVMAVIAVRLLIVNSFMPVLIAGTGVLTIGVALRCVWEAEPVYLALGGTIVALEAFLLLWHAIFRKPHATC